jgi:hypothetical protein
MRMLIIPIKPVTSVAYGFDHTTVAVSDVEEDILRSQAMTNKTSNFRQEKRRQYMTRLIMSTLGQSKGKTEKQS